MKFLPTMVASIAHQTYDRVEHIIVDGASTDGTAEFLAQLPNARHQIIIRRDRSMYEAINTGIQASSGEIVACLNADDLYFPDTLEYIAQFMHRHPDVDIAYGDQLSLFPQASSFYAHVLAGEQFDPWGLVLVYISQPTVFVRRHVFDRVGLFDPELRGAGDFDFWFRAFRCGARFKHFPRTVAIVRLHGANLSMTESWKEEHESLKRKYLPSGLRAQLAERYRLLKRRILVNRLALPLLETLPREFVNFDRARYYGSLVRRRPSRRPILTVRTPYFEYAAFHAPD